MNKDDFNSLRRDIKYAALPGKAASAFVALLLCLLIGIFGTAVAAYVCGILVRHFGGGF